MDARMAHYLVKRLLRAVFTVAGVVTLVFLLARIVPGDPVATILGDQSSPEDRASMRKALLLDRPLPAQYAAFVGDVLNGSLGHSYRKRDVTVASLIEEAAPSTVALAVAALVIALFVALPLGSFAALRRGSQWDRSASFVALLGLAIPHVWLGPLLVLLFAVILRWLPLPGGDEAGFRALILPAVTVGLGLAAILTRQTRASMIEVMREQYITAARARGLSESAVVLRHGLRNALIPVITIAASQLGALLGGAVIAEKIFERPGLGSLFLEAFFNRDFPVIQGCVVVFGTTYVIVNLVTDLLYAAVDPRVRLGT